MTIFLVIESPIGAGKSTLVKVAGDGLRAKGYRVVEVQEPVSIWVENGSLQAFYEKKLSAYAFQTQAFHDRVRALQETVRTMDPRTDVVLMERSVFSDKIFVDLLHKDGEMTDLEVLLYEKWWSMWTELIDFIPSCFVYLRTDLDECMSRMKSRAREGEGGVPRDYQTRLLAGHDEMFGKPRATISWFGNSIEIPVVEMDGQPNYRDNPEEKVKVVEFFEGLLKRFRSPKLTRSNGDVIIDDETQMLIFSKNEKGVWVQSKVCQKGELSTVVCQKDKLSTPKTSCREDELLSQVDPKKLDVAITSNGE